MKRVMVILVVALIVGAGMYVLGNKMGKKSAIKALANGATATEEPDDAEHAPAA